MAEAVFDVVAEDPEEKSVAQYVAPPTVQEHRDERRKDVDGVVVDDARHPSPERHRRPNRGHVCQLSGNHPQIAHAGSKRLLIEAGSLDENPGSKHRYQDGVRHPGRADSRKFVAYWNHRCC